MTREGKGLVEAVESYLAQYLVFPDDGVRFAVALWIVGTYLWPDLDVFPYLAVTSSTKRSGKTRLLELISFTGANPRWLTSGTAPTMFYMIRDESPIVLVDEAERLSGEAAGPMREAMNSGYRRGQTIPRMGKGQTVEHWPIYCPKVFSLIGDVNDTLRDRSIVVQLRRGTPAQMDTLVRFVWSRAEAEGNALGVRVKAEVEEVKKSLLDAFLGFDGLAFLTDRDEELWTPLFVLAQRFTPGRVEALQRIAVDLATLKTAEARSYDEQAGAEDAARDDEYAQRLLHDLLTVMHGTRYVYTAEALTRLQALATGPWRKYRGTGLTAMTLSAMLSRFGVTPKLIRDRAKSPYTGKGQAVARGYRRDDVERAVKAL